MEKEIDRQIISKVEKKQINDIELQANRIENIHRDFDRDREEIGLNANTIEEKRYEDFGKERCQYKFQNK